jgi:anhydro-N-acetylmuramic acid kinase
VYLCGGGAHNQLLVDALQALLGAVPAYTTKNLGIDVDWVEAVAFAWLAKQTLENKPSNLPAVTGASGLRVLGAICPK